jgi:hypothetical protein
MDYGKVLKRTWHLVWSHRALWIFGAILALTTVNGFYFGHDWNQDESPKGIAVKIAEDHTIYIPGDGLTIDMTGPHGISIWFDDGGHQRELRELGDLFADVVPRDVRVALIVLGIVLAGMIMVGIVARYVAEAALIRMVNQTEETGEKVGLRQGLRLGFSRSAWRMFLIDLTINLPVTLSFLLLFVLSLVPLGLCASGSTVAGVLGTLLTTGLLFLWVILLMAVNAVLSLLVQVVRRACGVEDLGAWASIRQGIVTVRSHLRKVGLVWLIWLSIRLLWMLAAIPALIVLSPILLLSVLGGAVVGAVPALAVGVLLTPFLTGPFPWIVGAIVALPIFILVTIAPMLLLGGLVEVGKSGLWTLAYRELLALEHARAAQESEPGVSGLEPAPAIS